MKPERKTAFVLATWLFVGAVVVSLTAYFGPPKRGPAKTYFDHPLCLIGEVFFPCENVEKEV